MMLYLFYSLSRSQRERGAVEWPIDQAFSRNPKQLAFSW
jgi:hypothetical protein